MPFVCLSSSKSLNPYCSPPPHFPKKKPAAPSNLRLGNAVSNRELRTFAGRSKSKPGGSKSGRIEGDSKTRRQNRRSARRKSNQQAESFFYRLKNPNKIHADNFTTDQLNLIGLGYDRFVRFMEKDDPNLRHPYDWYKYGEFGPYSWRGVVIGDPVMGKITDECVTLYSEVRNHEEREKSEQHEMAVDFGARMKEMNKELGLRYYWVFVRHPKWRLAEKPWEQWTLVSEVVVEAGKKRIDKWSLMGRLGNKARRLITQCAAWFRPDIVYVKRPVYQCRFEPQDAFFKALFPFLDPETEKDVLFEVVEEDGRVARCTYYEGICRIVRVSQKAYVDDVVNAYEKMSDERKSRCLEFVLGNTPVPLLHPYTVEWKNKLDEMEFGCDAAEEDDLGYVDHDKAEFVEWLEDDEEDDAVLADGEADVLDLDDEDEDEEENEEYWEKKLLSAGEEMEAIARRSAERTTAVYRRQLNGGGDGDGDETALRGVRPKVSPEQWKIAGIGRWNKRIKKSKIPPEVFLPAAIRPFTYRNLVKEIVLLRHAILDGDVGRQNGSS